MLKHITVILFSLSTFLIADPPEWNLYAPNYEYVMSVTSRIYNPNNLTTDIGEVSDVLGAFHEEDCVGLAEAAEVPVFLGGGYAFLVQVYSNVETGEIISFQFYSNTEDTIYTINENLNFISDAIIGDLVNPLMLTTQEESNNENSAPIANHATYTVDEDNSITIYLSASDIDGDVLNLSISEAPNHGIVTLAGNVATYIPDANYNGMDNFTFLANDGQSNSNIATITLVINAINDAPYLWPMQDIVMHIGETANVDLYATDVDGDDLSYTAQASGDAVTMTIVDNMLLFLALESDILTITATVSDGSANYSTTFSLTVLDSESCEDEYNQGFLNGAATGDANGDGTLNIIDIVQFIDIILNGE